MLPLALKDNNPDNSQCLTLRDGTLWKRSQLFTMLAPVLSTCITCRHVWFNFIFLSLRYLVSHMVLT